MSYEKEYTSKELREFGNTGANRFDAPFPSFLLPQLFPARQWRLFFLAPCAPSRKQETGSTNLNYENFTRKASRNVIKRKVDLLPL